jgi:hypothetical protein
MNNLDADLIEFVRTYRGPYPIYEAAGDLAALGDNGGNWPKANAQHWKRELDRLVADGKLQEVDGGLIVPLSSDAKQLELF